MAQSKDNEQSTNIPKTDTPAPTQPNPVQNGPTPEELAAREAALVEREKAAADALTQAQSIEQRVNEKLEKLDSQVAALNRDVSKDAVTRTNEEKADLVEKLQDFAYEGQDVGELVDFTPTVNLANVTNAGVIGYERGLTYRVPKKVVEDLLRRQTDFMNYQEDLHVRNVNILDSGTISGAGK
jgi:hypothetical protein